MVRKLEPAAQKARSRRWREAKLLEAKRVRIAKRRRRLLKGR